MSKTEQTKGERMKRRMKKDKKIFILLIIVLILLQASFIIAEESQIQYKGIFVTSNDGNLQTSGELLASTYDGSANYNYIIETMPGTNNLQPLIYLNYNSYSFNKNPNLLGSGGWSLTENYISKEVNSSFSNTNDDYFKINLNGQIYDLVYIPSENRYHTRIESYLYIENKTNGNNTNNQYFVVKDNSGNQYRFGYNNDSELVSNLYNYTIKWSLDLINDTHNNLVYYTYKEDPYPNDLGTVYIDKIEYNNDRKRKVDFIFESVDRSDMRIIYSEGNKEQYSRRLKEIVLSTNDSLVRRYLLNYDPLGDIQMKSLISNISEYGEDNSSILIVSNFSYNVPSVGWTRNDSWEPPIYLDNSANILMDVNNDGLIDVLFGNSYDTGDDAKRAYINNGSGWTRNDSWEPPIFLNNEEYKFGDVNGDGLIDILWGNDDESGDDAKRAYINNIYQPCFLKSITTSFLGLISIDYKKSTYLNNKGEDNLSDLGFNVWIVSNITKNNTLPGVQNVISVVNYNYSGGKYDYAEKEFRGFNYVEEKIDNKVIEHWFHQDNARKGLEYKSIILDSQGNLYKIDEQNWNYTTINGYYLTNLLETSEKTFDKFNLSYQTRNTSYSYDAFGNVIMIYNKGDALLSGDEKYEYFEYLNNSNKWIVNKLKKYSLFSSDNSTKIKEIKYTYDYLSYESVPDKGDLTTKQFWLNNSQNITTNYSYDQYGNLVNETNSRGYLTRYIYGLRDTTNTFIDRIINAKGQITDYNYNLGTGNLIWKKDSNGQFTNYTYDVFGRVIQEIQPYDNVTFPTVSYSYFFNESAPVEIKISRREQNGTQNTHDQYLYYDGFGYLVQNKLEANGNMQIVKDIYYDSNYRVLGESNPYLINFYENYSSPNQNIKRTNYTYNSLDLPIQINNPDNTFKNITYDGWNVTYYDENGNRIDYDKDAYGRINYIREYLSGNIYNTTYTYDSSDNLIKIVDSLGNVFNWTYDSLDRNIRIMDPDIGILYYSYDSEGNLINQTDNGGNVILKGYDPLNRVLYENTSTKNITYLYDLDKNSSLSKTRINFITINNTYDNRLRKISETKTIDNILFVTNWTYDDLDRVITERLPNGDIINYTYGSQGLLSSVSNLVNLSYNEQNQILSRIYFNNLTTNYTYNSTNFRLSKIKTGNKQELNYNYDNVGNVKQINDSIHFRLFSMNYDSLNRLVSTQIVNLSGNNSRLLLFTYNSIGNLLQILDDFSGVFNFSYDIPIHAPSKLTISEVTPIIDLDLIYPMDNINVTYGEFFEFIVNITCKYSNCGEINVSLDPISLNSTKKKKWIPHDYYFVGENITIKDYWLNKYNSYEYKQIVSRISLNLNNSDMYLTNKTINITIAYPSHQDFLGLNIIDGGFPDRSKKILSKNIEIKEQILNKNEKYLEFENKIDKLSDSDKNKLKINEIDNYSFKTFEVKFAEEDEYLVQAFVSSEYGLDEKIYFYLEGSFAGGSGTSVDPYQIENWEQLAEINDYLTSSFVLINNLNSSSTGYDNYASNSANSGAGWLPIGNQTSGYYFLGTFDGENHTISDLYISRISESNVGLFGFVYVTAINNVGILNCNVSGFDNVGSLGGYLYITDVINSFSTGNITGYDSLNGRVGGLIGRGYFFQYITNCYSRSNVYGLNQVGGLVGGYDNYGVIENSYSSGLVSGTSNVGGLVGSGSMATANNCFWDNQTSEQSTSAYGTGKTTAQMQAIETFSSWDIVTVENLTIRNTDYTWNIVNGSTYPFLSWEYLDEDQNETSNQKAGLISTIIGDLPFYTNESNPRTINLSKGQSQLVVFWVNATGDLNTSHTFFAYANLTSNMNISNMTKIVNVTILSNISSGAGENHSWITNLTINSSLPTMPFQSSTPSVFQKDGNWYLVSGDNGGTFYGYAWNGTQWKTNLTINASLPDIGNYATPSVFQKDGNWYLISGNYLGTFNGYAWNGTQWNVNNTINASLPDIGDNSAPSVFQKNGIWYLISGASDGKFYGYRYDGTQWLMNTTINASLPDIGDGSLPSVFYKDSSWYLISGASDGKFYSYVYI